MKSYTINLPYYGVAWCIFCFSTLKMHVWFCMKLNISTYCVFLCFLCVFQPFQGLNPPYKNLSQFFSQGAREGGFFLVTLHIYTLPKISKRTCRQFVQGWPYFNSISGGLLGSRRKTLFSSLRQTLAALLAFDGRPIVFRTFQS